MNSKLSNAIMFTVGAAIGSVVTWKLLYNRYNKRVQEEVDSVKETFSNWAGRNESTESSKPKTDNPEEDEEDEYDEYDEQDKMKDRFEYEAELRRLKYTSVTPVEEGGGDLDEHVDPSPYVITPDMYGDDGYDIVSLTYYADGVVEDDLWNILDHVDDIIGDDFMNHFGDYAEDTVFIRNERLKTDYEITRLDQTCGEYHGESPER